MSLSQIANNHLLINNIGKHCRIDEHYVIKVADFGLTEDVYGAGYFRQDKQSPGPRLPFKWMAPESLQDGVFSEKSDVVNTLTYHSTLFYIFYVTNKCVI